jgi:hypothetical protein
MLQAHFGELNPFFLSVMDEQTGKTEDEAFCRDLRRRPGEKATRKFNPGRTVPQNAARCYRNHIQFCKLILL